MPKFQVNLPVIIEGASDMDVLSRAHSAAKYHKWPVNGQISVEKLETPYETFESAKAAFYAACEKGYQQETFATHYLDAAIKALHQRQLDTVQLLSVWQDVKPYM